MPRVLLVTSSFEPATIADMHRARQLAWELPSIGWDTDVLYPNVEFQRSEYLEADSTGLFDTQTQRHEVAPHAGWLFRLLNMRSIGWRALWPLYRAGARLLRGAKFDLVYITTANFALFCLGRLWKRVSGTPYVLDYQDPWVRPRTNYRTTDHTVKLRIVRLLSHRMEQYALTGAAGIVSVSPAYLTDLRKRYGDLPCLQPGRCVVIPFAGSERDMIRSPRSPERSDKRREVVYVGAGGSLMARSFTIICEALAEVRQTDPHLVESLKIRMFGTHSHWIDGDPKPFELIAQAFGLAGVIEEQPTRVTYRKAMELAAASDGLCVLGVDDVGYMPSKLFTYALSGKPLLACFRWDSPARDLFDKMPTLGNMMKFDVHGTRLPDATNVMRRFLTEVGCTERFDRRSLVAAYLAPAMARRHAELFERIRKGSQAA